MSLMNQIGDLGTTGGSIGLANQVGRLLIPKEYKIGDIDIDTIISESHQSTADVTRYPTEAGIHISDHVTIAPYTVTVSGVISDIANNEFADFAMIGLAKSTFESIGGLFSGDEDEKDENKSSLTRSQEVWRQLQNIQASGQTISFHSQLRDYEDMVISSLSCTQDKDSKMSVNFTATLTQIVKVDFLSVSAKGLTFVKNPETETAKNNATTDDRLSTSLETGVKKGSSVPFDLIFGG